jgi:hypothetical protein
MALRTVADVMSEEAKRLEMSSLLEEPEQRQAMVGDWSWMLLEAV